NSLFNDIQKIIIAHVGLLISFYLKIEGREAITENDLLNPFKFTLLTAFFSHSLKQIQIVRKMINKNYNSVQSVNHFRDQVLPFINGNVFEVTNAIVRGVSKKSCNRKLWRKFFKFKAVTKL